MRALDSDRDTPLLYDYKQAAQKLGLTEQALRDLVWKNRGPVVTEIGRRRPGVEYGPEESEPEILGLDLITSNTMSVPRLTVAAISLECRLTESIAFGSGDNEFIVGEVTLFHIRDDLYEAGKIDSAKLRPICRVAGPSYASLGDITTFKPTYRSAHITKRQA